jgi:hypothetical protein
MRAGWDVRRELVLRLGLVPRLSRVQGYSTSGVVRRRGITSGVGGVAGLVCIEGRCMRGLYAVCEFRLNVGTSALFLTRTRLCSVHLLHCCRDGNRDGLCTCRTSTGMD